MYNQSVSDLQFEWDQRTSGANLRKHGVGFDEAQSVFTDDSALLRPDPDHSTEEERFLLIGFSAALRMLLVCHCYRSER